MRVLLVLPVVAVLSSCSVDEQTAEGVVRQEAKLVVNGLVADRFPGLNAAPITDCIIDAASTQEIVTIGASAVTGTTTATSDLIFGIAQRPEAVSCIANNSAGLLTL